MPHELFEALEGGKLTRRQFLKALGLAAGAAVAGPALLARGQEEIVIGALGPVGIFVGKGIQYGAQLAVEEINARGGVLGRPIRLEIADTKMDPGVGVAAVEDLVITRKAKMLVGLFRSEVVMAVLPTVARLKVPLFIVGSTFPGATQRVAEDYDTYKYIFRPMLNGNFLGVNLIEFSTVYLAGWLIAKGLLRNNRVAIVAEDLLWVKPLVGLLQQTLPQVGAEIVDTYLPAVGTTDFSPILADIEGKDAAATITIFSDPTMVPFVPTWAKMEVPTGLFGINAPFHAPQTCFGIGGLAEGIVEVEPSGGRTAITAKTIPFFDAYTERFGEEPVYTSFITYDSVYLWAEAVEKAGTPEPDKVIPFIEGTDWVGATGRIQFYGKDPTAEDPKYGRYAFPHDSKYGPGLIYPVHVQFREGCVKEIIWPFEYATGSYLLPPWMRRG